MARFRLEILANLARQMEFAPREVRAVQLASAEAFLHTVEPTRAYPADFVVFRITGYRPKSVAVEELTGLALQHDLGLLIELVSDTLDVRSASLQEPVLSIDDVTERFSVTSKTIQRWRRKGLPARRFVFPDGKRRVGFLLSSVERFFAARGEQVARGTNFNRIDEAELAEILRRARRLATMCHCCGNEISRRIGRKLNRSPATILHTIRKHDAEHPSEAVFPGAAEPIADSDRAGIIRQHRRGVPIRTLAKRACRPRSAIYRLLVEERIARINRRKVRFIDDPLYHQPDADGIMEALAGQEVTLEIGPQRQAEPRLPRDLPSNVSSLCAAPLLSPARERALFLKFNYHKMRFVTARRRLEPEFARVRDLNVLEGHLRRAQQTRNDILRANMRLVVSTARHHLRPGLSLMELVSEGTMTLMRAIEAFDVHRGFKFSTYATLALMKGYARGVAKMQSSRAAGAPEEPTMEVVDRRAHSAAERFLAREEVNHLLQRLDGRERDIVRGHFGIGDSVPATYDQLAERLGLSKERVRQIERSALTKLRIGQRA